MSVRTLELKLAAPVICSDCDWSGRTGSLVSNGSDDHMASLRCPICYGARIVWIQNEAPEAIQ